MNAITYAATRSPCMTRVMLGRCRVGTIFRTETPNGFRWFYRPYGASKIHDGPLHISIEAVKADIEGARA